MVRVLFFVFVFLMHKVPGRW